MRGEYQGWGRGGLFPLELPPRARRLRYRSGYTAAVGGKTSACAVNTRHDTRRPDPAGNYLRVRGEYSWASAGFTPNPELPPRARRIRAGAGVGDFLIGTTSACAENTGSRGRPPEPPGNYLRVRGEYIPMVTILMRFLELPPRARRILLYPRSRGGGRGTTSACAENTRPHLN